MTRDEAVAIAKKSKDDWGGGSSELWLVNALVALGMLKLDEPNMVRVSQSVMRRAESALRMAIQVGSPDDPMVAADIIGCLDDAGLKIVEK